MNKPALPPTRGESRPWAALCLALALALALLLRPSVAFYLEGARDTFAQFPSWAPGPNGSLELAFQTREPHGLLLYADDGGAVEFFELKMVEGAVRLRYNLGGGARLLTVGKALHDGERHKVRVQRRFERTELIVDAHVEGRSGRSGDLEFGSPAGNSLVWVGGLPAPAPPVRLSLPAVALEPSFAGEVGALVYTGPDGVPRVQTMIAGQVSSSFARGAARNRVPFGGLPDSLLLPSCLLPSSGCPRRLRRPGDANALGAQRIFRPRPRNGVPYST